MVMVVLGMFVGRRVVQMIGVVFGQQGLVQFGWRINPVCGRPGQPLTRREATAMAPALLGRTATALVPLAGIGRPALPNERFGPVDAEHRRHVRKRKQARQAAAAGNMNRFS